MSMTRWDSEEATFKIVDEEYLNEVIRLSEKDLKYRMEALISILNTLETLMIDLSMYYRKLHQDFVSDEQSHILTFKLKKEKKPMHKKIMKKAAKALKKDAAHYAKEAKSAKSPAKKKHEKVERKEALSAAKDLKKRARTAHEY